MSQSLRRVVCSLLLLASAVVPLRAQTSLPLVTIGGRGPATWVLITGLVGGVSGYDKLRQRLMTEGHRVIVIDPYAMSLDSQDVSFAALARRVDAMLSRLGVDSAAVVGHAHGAGVALRLAAANPARVSALYFLDVGALTSNKTKVFSGALRFVPLITRLPGGRRFVRSRFVAGMRQNSGRPGWITTDIEHAYADPILDHIDQVVDLAGRLAASTEPESLATVVERVRAPVTVILGDVPHPSMPDSGEVERLAPLGARLRVEHLPGVGHFPHEEAVDDVMRILRTAKP